MNRRTGIPTAAGAALLLGAAALCIHPVAPQRVAAPAALKSTPIGRKIDDVIIHDLFGKPHTLSEWADSKFLVVAFLGTDCPLSKLYGPRLDELAREFGSRGVAFVGVNPNAQDSLADLAAFVRLHKIAFPLFKDINGAAAERMGAVRTPEVFVLDADRVVRYWGRVDDQYGVGARRPTPIRRHLAEALVELLDDKLVSLPAVPSVGCRIGRLPPQKSSGDVTYANQISRLLQRRCVECHRAGEAGPFPLTDYRNAADWSAMIGEVVADDRMPPWFADPRHGRFRNDARLTPEEKSLLFRWIDDGCPEGGPAAQPAPLAASDGWRIPMPDQIIYMADQPYEVPADDDVPYQYFKVDPGFTEDKYVQAAEVRPGDAAVVHHALVMIVPPGEGVAPDSAGALLDYAPGMAPTALPPGAALRVAAGSKFLFQMHYTPNGSHHRDRTSLALAFADPKTVKISVRGGAVFNTQINIPAGARDYSLTAEYTAPQDIMVLNLSPHLHLRGKSFRFEAIYPDGGRETLLDVPRWDFNWQLRYDLAQPARLPKGTRLVCTAHWDNSADNPNNPDPMRQVRWGDRTDDEMMIGFFAYSLLN
ncbi:MAG TPA: redoxin domain-containing protein [Gemmataceae bacterium]|nr:redoxin domain-containing protein [Gemmataceae bacterium]